MRLFFDTSALVKFFHEEDGSENVTELVTSPDNEIWVSELARIEFLSALLRRFRNKEITEEKLDEAISGFNETIVSFNVEPLGQAIIREAESLMRKAGKRQGIRTLDALHIGTFTLISGDDWVFVAADKTLCGIIQSIGFKAINPIEGY